MRNKNTKVPNKYNIIYNEVNMLQNYHVIRLSDTAVSGAASEHNRNEMTKQDAQSYCWINLTRYRMHINSESN